MLTENTQAVMLLTCYFSKPRKEDAKPLTVSEYARFAEWLLANKFQPSSLFDNFDEVFSKWSGSKKNITADRVKQLLGRGMAMSLALEKWQQVGIWFLTRSDNDYPLRLKQKLGTMSPPVIFGLGNKQLLNAGGLAVVGSRSIEEEDVSFTKDVGYQASFEGINIVSGGAKGVDETSMLSSLEAKGTALGILADSLYKAALSAKWRRHLEAENLCLVSPYYPEAGFSSGNAMGRNKYIYCLADYALVVRSDKDKGGTWAGATENLKKGWISLFVKPAEVDGNKALLEIGGNAFNIPLQAENRPDNCLRNALSGDENKVRKHCLKPLQEVGDMFSRAQAYNTGSQAPDQSQLNTQEQVSEADMFFGLFISQLRKILNQQPDISQAELARIMSDLHSEQIANWLDRAESENLIKRVEQHGAYKLAS